MDRHKLVHGEALSMEKFAAPSQEFGIMPFWFWNGRMDYAEMEYQLREYKAKGLPGLLIHARFGIREAMEYLGEEWFDRVRFTIEKAQEIGLQVWVYDEYNWPSGTAGQTIQRDDPELTNVYLELVGFDLPGQFFTFLEGTDSRYVDMEQSEPLYACAIRLEDLEKGRFDCVDLMPSLSFDKVITGVAPKGPWKLCYFVEKKAGWYTDVLNPQTTQRFLEYTHERYKAAQGGSFRPESGAQGFYTDEPAMFYFEAGRDAPTLPWSRQMFKIFRRRNGYDLKKRLPQLFFDIGPDYEQVRHDFWRALSDQYDDAYYKQLGDWCRENGTVFTGHLMHEESLRMQAKTGGNLFAHLRHLHLTGVDHLYPRVGTREMPSEHVAIKIASSAAHQFGSVRLLCESMGGAYWDCTMERMKWIADWEYVLGVNIFNPHGYHYSIEGERKRDWPPSQFYHHTWWPQYGLFNQYLSRAAYLLTGGHHVAKVAILYPIHSIWANYRPQVRDRISDVIEKDFVYMTDRLLRLHIDFDYIDEDVLAECEIDGGSLCLRGERYEMLLLPPITHIKQRTLHILEAFHAAGGKLGGDALLPCRLVDGSFDGVKERVRALFGLDPEALRASYMKGAAPTEVTVHRCPGAVFLTGAGLWQADAAAALREAMLACITPEIRISSEEVFYLHRVKDGRDFYFLVNPTGDAHRVDVDIAGEYTPELWDLESGGRAAMPVYRIREGRTCFALELMPYGSAMVSVSDPPAPVYAERSDIMIDEIIGGKVCGYARLDEDGQILLQTASGPACLTVPARQPMPPLAFSDTWRFETDKPNALLIHTWKFRLEDGSVDPLHLSRLPEDWLDFGMGAWEMQLPEERDEPVYPVDLWFAASFHALFVPWDLKLMIDGFKGESHALYINGQRVTAPLERSYLDAEIMTADIAPFTKPGDNLLLVRITARKKMDGLLDPLKLIGTFRVDGANGRESIAPITHTLAPGDWVSMGFPYYAGTGIYSQTLTLPAEYADKKLFLEAEVGRDVLEVHINGTPAATRLWWPYRVELTGLLVPGENKLELRVINTLANLLEGSRIPSGLFSARIVPYDRYLIGIKEETPC